MADFMKDIYFLVEDALPLRPVNYKKSCMEEVLFQVMGHEFMEEYAGLDFMEDLQSRMDLFRYSIALGAKLGSFLD